MPTSVVTNLLSVIERPYAMMIRLRQEKINRLIALLKLRISASGDPTKFLRALRRHDPLMVEVTFIYHLDSLEQARLEARRASESVEAKNLEDAVTARLSIYAADKAYGLAAAAYDAYILYLLE